MVVGDLLMFPNQISLLYDCQSEFGSSLYFHMA